MSFPAMVCDDLPPPPPPIHTPILSFSVSSFSSSIFSHRDLFYRGGSALRALAQPHMMAPFDVFDVFDGFDVFD